MRNGSIPEQRGHEIAGRVVMTIEQHTDDPSVLYAAKRQLIDEIIAFDAGPMIYVQTTPMENSTLTEHSSVEVFGWTEPGTKIVVNGKEMPVSDQGYFFEQFGGDAIDTTKIPHYPENDKSSCQQYIKEQRRSSVNLILNSVIFLLK